ncbi:hypothetical protein HPY42_03580 [Coprothermobacteraceae bacterium]|nr:hypothetical protein [Coprothermobacteraceae bacterium]
MTTASSIRLPRVTTEPRYVEHEHVVSPSRATVRKRIFVVLIMVNFLLVGALGFLAFRVANHLYAVEAASRLVLQSQQEIWRLNMDLDLAIGSKMMAVVGQDTATNPVQLVGQR